MIIKIALKYHYYNKIIVQSFFLRANQFLKAFATNKLKNQVICTKIRFTFFILISFPLLLLFEILFLAPLVHNTLLNLFFVLKKSKVFSNKE